MSTKQSLSKRQHKLFTFIAAYVAEHGYPPLQSEMAEHMGIATASVNGMLFILEARGWMIRQRGWIRAWMPVNDMRGAA